MIEKRIEEMPLSELEKLERAYVFDLAECDKMHGAFVSVLRPALEKQLERVRNQINLLTN
jgi:hypothetical protein